MALLEVHELHTYYGNIHALKGISLTVGEDEIVTLIGANGAGKTTTLRAVSGTVRRSGGEIRFAGHRLRGGPEAVAKAGIAHVPEGRGTFTELSVLENLRLGAYTRRDRQVRQDVDRVDGWFPWLRERADQQAVRDHRPLRGRVRAPHAAHRRVPRPVRVSSDPRPPRHPPAQAAASRGPRDRRRQTRVPR